MFDELGNIETATVGHIRSSGFMRPNIRSVLGDVRICGPALTVMAPSDDGTALVHALSNAQEGQILVVDRGNDERHACWGAVLTAAAQSRGVLGAIIDGFVTDLSDIKKANFPVWCRGLSPLTTKIRGEGGHYGQPVSCGGVAVSKDDIILADENGVVVLKPSQARQIIDKALEIQSAEPDIIAQLRAGKKLSDLTNPPDLPAHLEGEK